VILPQTQPSHQAAEIFLNDHHIKRKESANCILFRQIYPIYSPSSFDPQNVRKNSQELLAKIGLIHLSVLDTFTEEVKRKKFMRKSGKSSFM